jgi:hypothetical protein
MARPKLNEEEKLSRRFIFRLTAAEFDKLTELGKVCGKAPGILVRNKIFKGKFPEPKSAKLDREVYYELKKIGVNLNQLARKANSRAVPIGLSSLIIKLLKQEEVIINLLLHDRQPENR